MFLCVGPNCWGRGLTEEEAMKNARANLPRYQSGHFSYNLYEGTDRIWVDEMGRIRDFEQPKLLSAVRLDGGERVTITEYENDSQLPSL